jgi:50S ribosomal subunit-associated GTPase HflX
VVILPETRPAKEEPGSVPKRSNEERLAEAVSLAEAIGLEVTAALVVPVRNRFQPRCSEAEK